MPTLFRFLFVIATVAAMIYAAMWALVIFVEPGQREITAAIPAAQIKPQQPSP
ncbi:hypothetical protein HGO34_10685 [Agrobacterium vitis]|uniref:hypothetical protein n=1 Tax=Agrobacterium vitis TaxID=373 RepID=UPI0018D22B8F|nr:hypothetical protein [Agrobacterium vitis]MCM2440179.1 hypothetical protein [Agrobacterium vitis]